MVLMKLILCLFYVIEAKYDEEFSENKIVELEKAYNSANFLYVEELLKQAKNTLSTFTEKNKGIITRIEGHLCFFGKHKDVNVDLNCAWKNYLKSASYGDGEAYFYVGFILDHYLFLDLKDLRILFPENKLIYELDDLPLYQMKEILEGIAQTCYYLSSLQGYPLARLVLGRKEIEKKSPCEVISKYYIKFINHLIANYTFDPANPITYELSIFESTDPFKKIRENFLHLNSIRLAHLFSYFKNAEKRTEALVFIAKQYILLGEYELLKDLSQDVYLPSNDKKAIRGFLYYYGVTVPQNYSRAFKYFKKSLDKRLGISEWDIIIV